MSASREKKQRQGAGPSEKALQAQQQQAARKQKVVIYTAIGVVIAALVAALLIWNSGFFQARATAATVGGENLSVAEMSYYYHNARMNVYYKEFQYYSYFGLAIPSESDVRDSSTGQTYRDYYLETALRTAQENKALADEARKNGHTEAEVKDSLKAQIQRLKTEAAAYNYSYASYLKAMYGSYMSTGVYERLYQQALLASLVYNEKANELLDGYTEADLNAYYEADDHADSLDTFEYSYLYFTPTEEDDASDEGDDANAPDESGDAETPDEGDDAETPDDGTDNASDEDGEEDAALAEAKANAEAALEAVKNGSSIASLAEKYDLADSAFGDHVSAVGISRAISAVQDKLLSMKDGDAELVENGESGYYVVTLHSRKRVEDPTKDVRHILAMAETTTDEEGNVVAPTAEAWAAAKAEIEAIQAEYESGDRTEDSFAALANAKSDDGDGTTGGLYTKIDVNDQYVSEFLDWIFTDGRKAGDVSEPVRHEGDPEKSNQYWGYHLIYLVGDNEPLWMREARNTLTEEDLKAWLDGLADNYEATLTGGADRI